jgi:hypothetical protein
MNESPPSPTSTRVGYLVASLACFIAGAISFDFLVPLLAGTTRSRAGGSIVVTVLLYAPFVALALMADAVERKASRIRAVLFFGFFACVFGWLYLRGYWSAEIALAQGHWTAASLSVGLLPFKSVPVLAVAGVSALLIRKLG